MERDRLTAERWLEAAFRALTRAGPSAIKAEAIARDLGVSKGSFYWHFANVPALKSSMLTHWQEAATQAIIAEVEHIGDSPVARLQRLVALSTSGKEAPYGGPLAEAAIRDWARYENEVGLVVRQVDTARIDYIASLFQQQGADKNASRLFAGLLYSALVGGQILSEHELATPANELPTLLRLLLKQLD